MKRLIVLLAVASLTFVAAPIAASQTFAIDTGHSEVSFKIRHIVTNVRGGFDLYEGRIVLDEENPANSSVTFSIDASSINTRHDRRDEHLRSEDFFWIEKHPTITFESTNVKKVGQGYLVTGDLTMRGVTKAITLPVEFAGTAVDPWGGTRAGFSAEATLDRKAFDIVWNKALDQGGTVLGDEVSIEINIEAVQEKPETEGP